MLKGVDHIGISVVSFCHDGTGRFAMGKRSIHTRDEHGRWDFAGGALEFDESIEDGARREVREEFGTDALKLEFLGFRDVHRVHDGENTHWIGFDFKVLVDPNQVKNGEPRSIDEIGWFTKETRPSDELLHSQIPLFFQKYDDKLWE